MTTQSRTLSSLLIALRAPLTFITAACLSIGTAAAQVSFENKKVEVLIGSEVGGGTDTSTRLIARYLAHYLPGNPSMIIRNMPGARGTLALNNFVGSPNVKPDGLTWIGGGSAHIDPNAIARPQVKYDPYTFRYIGAVTRGGSILVLRKEKLANLSDKSLPPIIVGTIDGIGSWEQLIMFGQKALGWNAKFVLGYRGTQEMVLALQRGEIDMTGTANPPLLQQMFSTGAVVGVAHEGGSDDSYGADQRAAFGNVPPMGKLVAGKLQAIAAEAFEFWGLVRLTDKWYALPAGTPDEIVTVYRTAFDKTVADPDFVKNAHAQFGEDFQGVTGTKIQSVVEKTTRPKKEVLTFIEDMKTSNGIRTEPGK